MRFCANCVGVVFIREGGNMLRKFKSTLWILAGVALVVQLAGCFFVDRDRRRHDDPPRHHDNDHDSGFDIRVHGG